MIRQCRRKLLFVWSVMCDRAGTGLSSDSQLLLFHIQSTMFFTRAYKKQMNVAFRFGSGGCRRRTCVADRWSLFEPRSIILSIMGRAFIQRNQRFPLHLTSLRAGHVENDHSVYCSLHGTSLSSFFLQAAVLLILLTDFSYFEYGCSYQ